MRLNLENSLVGSSTMLLVVSGVIDWSTIAQFRAGLSRLMSCPRPDILVDFAGLLSWSREAQEVLAGAAGEARLHGGRLVSSGLAPIPVWAARHPPDRALEVCAVSPLPATARPGIWPGAQAGHRRPQPDARRRERPEHGPDDGRTGARAPPAAPGSWPPPAAEVRCLPCTLRSHLKTSNLFPEFAVVFKSLAGWSFLAGYPQLCEAETGAFGRLLGRPVQRLATIARGDGVCTTHVTGSSLAAGRGSGREGRKPATRVTESGGLLT
jgi:hypothetical protein